MNPRVKLGVVFSSMMLTILLVVGAVLGKSEESDDGAYRPLSVYTEVLAHIKSDYVEDPDIDSVTEGALQGLVEYLDPSSSYLTAEQRGEYEQALENPDGGTGLSTGLVLGKRGSFTAVLAVLPESPADQAGISSGDLLEAIDDVSTRVLSPALLGARLSGEPGTTTRLLVRTARNYDEPEEFSLKRDKVRLPATTSKMLDRGVGYVKALVVDKERIKQIAAAARKLRSQGADKLILDLRENAVGEHGKGLDLADVFVAEGRLGSLKGQRYPERTFEAKGDDSITDLELVVIVDGRTAGAAELAAAALQDRDRATIVGERTYGLGSLLDTIELEDGAALILSVAKYYRTDGEAMQNKAVTPTETVAPSDLRRWRNPEEQDPNSKDPFLEKALEVLSGEAAKAA